MNDSSPAPQTTTALAGATLFAMTRFVEQPCMENAQQVARHLECAAEQAGGDPRLADLCFALALRWRGYVMRQLSSQSMLAEGH
ncbi:hypothetical protein [Viridibacterium curvum]|uniref:Uncharacterized protein n=1 Tax=Viridibacterium curvum TaxID=1101404 RepID=A0ABP9QZX1_9RHOO